jgi:hypothetical protein
MTTRVYHFIPEEHGLDDLRRRRIKISRFADLNDPFECFAAALPTRRHRTAMNGFSRDIDSIWGVLCFSRNWHNPLLWSLYADKHRGLCLGFDVDRESALSVTYATQRLLLDIRRQLAKKPHDRHLGRKLLTTKYASWKYEDEVRSIVELSQPDKATGMFFYEFNQSLRLRQVIVGCRSTLSKSALVNALSGHDRDCVKILKARLAFKTFRVVQQRNEKLWHRTNLFEHAHAAGGRSTSGDCARRAFRQLGHRQGR